MDFFTDMLWVTIGEMFSAFTSPAFCIVYLLLFMLLAWQYKRIYESSPDVHQYKKTIYLQSALLSSFFGIVGGFVGSLLLIILGIDLSAIGIGLLWISAILLMLVKPRFLCFAYAAGLIAIVKLLFGIPDINISQLIALVAVLHMVESLLILLNGPFNPVAVYVKKGGHIRGGFDLQLFWPIPLVALLSVSTSTSGNMSLMMPDWWPLLSAYDYLLNSSYILLPALAVLGYGEISTTRSPAAASRASAIHLALFSLTLLILSLMSAYWPVFLWAAALFSPLGHELVIWLGLRREANQSPIYVSDSQGMMLLAVASGSPAHKAGLRSRDIIMSVNGTAVNSYNDFLQQSNYNLGGLLKVNRAGKLHSVVLPGSIGQEIGLIPVPDQYSN